jgi:hypothetical protein
MTEVELTSLLFKLADLGITGVKVKYDGGGDSGAIEWIGYTSKPCKTPEDVNDIVNDWDNEYTLTNLDGDLYYQIESFVDEKLLNDIEDWWNNEGGYGNLCICVPSGKYIINNHVRVTQTEDYFHDGDLFSKTEEE